MISIFGFSDKVHAISRATGVKSYYNSPTAQNDLIRRLKDEIPDTALKTFAEQLHSMAKDDDNKLIDVSLNKPKTNNLTGKKLDFFA